MTWVKRAAGVKCMRGRPVTPAVIKEHLRGNPPTGVCPIKEGESTVRIAVLDLDSHKGETSWDEMTEITSRVCQELDETGCRPVAFRSSGGHGVHIFLVWDDPQDAYSVREFLKERLKVLGFSVGTAGVARKQIEIFPKQNFVPMGGAGNQFFLPLANKSVPLDSDLFYTPLKKEDASLIKWLPSHPVPVLEPPAIPKAKEKKKSLYSGDFSVLKTALDKLDPSADYDTWLKIGMALHQESGGSQEGLDLWDEWSAESVLYPGEDELAAKWRSFKITKNNVITAGFIKNLAEKNGWQDDYAADFEDVSDPATDLPKEIKKERYVAYPVDQYVNRPSVKWHIKKILPCGETMTFGASIAGKTFVVLDMVCHIAMGMDWNGHKTTRGKVMYICAEGAGGVTSRLKAWCMHHEVDLRELGKWLMVMPDTPNFLDEKDTSFLAQQIKKYQTVTDLLVVDTLAQATAGADENSSKDMGLALKNIKRISALLRCSYNLVHHTGKNEDRGARGSSVLKGQMDAMFYIFREENGEKRTFWVDKMKDDRDNFGFDFSLRALSVGTDEDFEPIESCYVEYIGAATRTKKSEPKRDMWEDVVLNCIDELDLEGKEATVPLILREICNKVPHDPIKRDDRRKSAVRALQALVKKAELRLEGDKVISVYDTE